MYLKNWIFSSPRSWWKAGSDRSRVKLRGSKKGDGDGDGKNLYEISKKERKKERIIASKGGRKMMRIAVIKNCLDSRNDDR